MFDSQPLVQLVMVAVTLLTIGGKAVINRDMKPACQILMLPGSVKSINM